ncbi:MAG: DUF4388 domain-containing protein [Thermoanaerobaculales bacterium]|nr:DUF4388 domain-containing protein [Thermoanaerobaculales bacterium]
MALEGTLRDFSFADILQLISLQRKTGVLTLKNEKNVVTISFLDGSIIGSSSLSQHPEDRIGLILLKRKEITEQELETGLKRQEETLQRLGRILIDGSMVPPEAVRLALSQQILQIVYRVFRWSDGDYHFSQETDIDYDRDLMRPLAADSIIMEGARMTDEWPFIDQRLPDRSMVLVKVDPNRRFDLSEEDENGFNDLGFSFSDTPEEEATESSTDVRLSSLQFEVYEYVDGLVSVSELIAESPFVEFDTCKALADLLDRGLIREASQQEVARALSRQMVAPVTKPSWGLGVVPWLAVPFLVLLGFSMSVMYRNPINPSFDFISRWKDNYLYEGVSWYRMGRLCQSAEDAFYLDGFYPENALELVKDSAVYPPDFADPWKREYQLVTRGHRLIVAGGDASGNQVQRLILSRPMAWEGEAVSSAASGPGVRLILR